MLSNFYGYNGIYDRFDNSAPYVHVRESDNAALVEIEVPRYRLHELEVDMDANHGILTVVGRRAASHHAAEFEHLIYASSPLCSFRKSFSFSPRLYDVAKYTTQLDAGVFTIIVPKQVQSQPLQIFGGNAEGQLVTTTTPAEFFAVRNSRWPPSIRHEETATSLTYKCDLPPTVTKDHIKLEVNGRSLSITIGYDYNIKTSRCTESQSLSYTTTLALPQGTLPSDISTHLDMGVLTITLAKHQSVPVLKN